MNVAIDAVGIRGHGAAAVLCELLRWLPVVRPGWQWHVFLFERGLREFDDPVVLGNVTIEHVGFGDSGWDRLRWVNHRLPVRLADIGADALFSFANIAPAQSVVPQVVFCHQRNAFFCEGMPRFAFPAKLRLLFLRRHILRGALASSAMIVQTEAMRERIAYLSPELAERIRVIPSGYRTPSPEPVVRPGKKALIDGASGPRLIYVSHPSEHKNHLALVNAMEGVLKSLPSASLLLTLDSERPGDRRYSAFIREIRDAADSRGVSDHIVWLGVLNPDEVDHALRSSDMSVFPSLSESFGLGLVESMAAGIPVAAADFPYAHDVCGDAAAYFDPRNPAHIAETVVRVCRDASESARLRALGDERKHLFSYERIAEDIASVITDSVG